VTAAKDRRFQTAAPSIIYDRRSQSAATAIVQFQTATGISRDDYEAKFWL
jgi:hypothetical protein